jgi:hypothetical protein
MMLSLQRIQRMHTCQLKLMYMLCILEYSFSYMIPDSRLKTQTGFTKREKIACID